MGLSTRLAEIVAELPVRPGMRVVEIGCGPGAAARAVAELVGPSGHVLAVDRSPTAIDQVERTSADLIAAGRLSTRCAAAEDLVLEDGEARYDLAFAIRVGAFDGRFPDAGARAAHRLLALLVPGGRLLIDGGAPLREADLASLSRARPAPRR